MNPADMEFVPFQGGLDLETPPWQVRPGFVRDSQNYEVGINGGYQDIQGYERFDGLPSPSEQIYQIIEVTISGSIEAGDTITGTTSTETAVVLRVVDEAHADYEDTVYLVVAKVSGNFDSGETLEVSSVVEATATSANQPSAARNSQLHAQYLALAADEYRGDIAAVPGVGAVWGVFEVGGSWYAIRDKVGGLTAGLYKENSSTGWTEADLGREMVFASGGTYEIQEGDVITGDSSGATATVERVLLESGTWAGGDAAGRLILSGQVDTFTTSDLLDVGANLNVAENIDGDSVAIALGPGGRLDYDKTTAFSGTGGERVYGATGVGRGFEFDGTVFIPIATGMAVDTPEHVIVHQHHLFFSFGPSVQHSGLGTPYDWTVILGASELNVGDDVTGFHREPGSAGNGALSIFSRNRIHILYGTDTSNWNLEPYRDEVGAYPHTISQVGQTMFLHERGITGLHTVQAFGNFAHNTLSNHIQTFLIARRGLATGSCIVRDKSQYRVFFSDGWALYSTMDGRNVLGMMPVKLEHPVTCIASEENADGSEDIMFGSSDGFVYHMEKGTSFDGEPIEAFMFFHFLYPRNSLGRIKRWLLASFEARGTGYAEFLFAYDLAYGDAMEATQPSLVTKEVDSTAVIWGEFIWDQFVWDSRALNPSRVPLGGEAENISLIVRKNSNYMQPMRFSGALIRYVMRARQVRS